MVFKLFTDCVLLLGGECFDVCTGGGGIAVLVGEPQR